MGIGDELGTQRGRRLAAGYLVVQAALAVLWWVLLLTAADVRAWFELGADRRSGLDAFLVADGLVFIGGSLAAAVAIWRGARVAGLITAFTAGGAAYATLYLVGWVGLEGTGAAGVVPMGVATVATTTIAVAVHRAAGPS